MLHAFCLSRIMQAHSMRQILVVAHKVLSVAPQHACACIFTKLDGDGNLALH